MKKIILSLAVVLVLMTSIIPSESISQIFKTSLQITIRNELGNVESDAKVTLYKTEEDYNASANPVATKNTDDKGRVMFEGVESVAYFVQAEKGDRDNSGAGEKTPVLDEKKVNKVTIIISE